MKGRSVFLSLITLYKFPDGRLDGDAFVNASPAFLKRALAGVSHALALGLRLLKVFDDFVRDSRGLFGLGERAQAEGEKDL